MRPAADRRHDLRDPPAERDQSRTPAGRPAAIEMALGMTTCARSRRAGGLPVVMPPLHPDAIEPLLDGLAGRLPLRRPRHRPGGLWRPDASRGRRRRARLDRFELALARCADARGLPILAICRGAQTLNVARGGTLLQHLPDLVGNDRAPPARARQPGHPPGGDRARHAAGARIGSASARGQLLPPSGGRPPRARPARGRPGRPTA